jgi:hypothetical protein
MQHAVNPVSLLPVDFSQPESKVAFNVAIIYEEIELGKLAKRTCDFLVDSIGLGCGFTHQIWKFDALSIPVFREVATQDAAGTDIVVLACQTGNLPSPVLSWLQTWLERAASPLALVALFDPGANNPQTLAARASLSSLAERSGVEFFTPGSEELDDHLPARDYPSPSRSERPDRDRAPYIVHDDYRGVTHWGINE